VTLFISDTERLLREMREALESGDVETLARLAHRLKSGSANVGALGMSAACKRMQNLATTPQAAEVLEELERMFLEVRPLLEEEIKRV
jgi:HPt (histidine-containing phosphotransfer) domain-containing protein